MGAPLVKTRTILKFVEFYRGEIPVFQPEDDEIGHGRMTRIEVDRDVWNDMGQPETITVTIEPGDLLNETET